MAIPVVLNISHASWEIPEKEFDQFIVPEWQLIYEHLVLVDWFTDELFSIPGALLVKAPFSRLLVDTAKVLTDEKEPMAAYGMGVIYMRGSRGQQIRRELTSFERQQLLDEYYLPHQEKLEAGIQSALNSHGSCLLVDCHSFPNDPFQYQQSTGSRPDFFIETTKNGSHQSIIDKVSENLSGRGFYVGINASSSRCLLPTKYVGNTAVSAIRIEVNRRLYMTQLTPPYTQESFSKEYLPERSGNFWDIKRVIRELVYGALGIQYAGPPDEQLNLSRFMRESASGKVSAEMEAWWRERY